MKTKDLSICLAALDTGHGVRNGTIRRDVPGRRGGRRKGATGHPCGGREAGVECVRDGGPEELLLTAKIRPLFFVSKNIYNKIQKTYTDIYQTYTKHVANM